MASGTKGKEGEVKFEREVRGEREALSLISEREGLQGWCCFLYSAQSTVKCLSVKIIYSESHHFK